MTTVFITSDLSRIVADQPASRNIKRMRTPPNDPYATVTAGRLHVELVALERRFDALQAQLDQLTAARAVPQRSGAACGYPIPAGRRRDAVTCSDACRTWRARERRRNGRV